MSSRSLCTAAVLRGGPGRSYALSCSQVITCFASGRLEGSSCRHAYMSSTTKAGPSSGTLQWHAWLGPDVPDGLKPPQHKQMHAHCNSEQAEHIRRDGVLLMSA